MNELPFRVTRDEVKRIVYFSCPAPCNATFLIMPTEATKQHQFLFGNVHTCFSLFDPVGKRNKVQGVCKRCKKKKLIFGDLEVLSLRQQGLLSEREASRAQKIIRKEVQDEFEVSTKGERGKRFPKRSFNGLIYDVLITCLDLENLPEERGCDYWKRPVAELLKREGLLPARDKIEEFIDEWIEIADYEDFWADEEGFLLTEVQKGDLHVALHNFFAILPQKYKEKFGKTNHNF